MSCKTWDDVDGLVQDSSISSANALDILQFCSKPSMYALSRRTAYAPFRV